MVLGKWEGQSAITQLYVHVALKKKGCCSRGEMGMTISVGPMHVCLHPPQVSPNITVMAGWKTHKNIVFMSGNMNE